MLHEFLTSKHEEIIARTRMKVAARSVPCATTGELAQGVPLFFDQLIETLKHQGRTGDEMSASATKHGDEMLRMGFTVGQLVHAYGDICQAVTELASELDAPIAVDEFHTLSRCLDDAIAQAVTEYGRLREKSLSEQGTERIGVLAREMRDNLRTAIQSLSLLQRGEVPIGGSTGALLDRCLKDLNDLVNRSLAQIRLDSTLKKGDTAVVAELVGEGTAPYPTGITASDADITGH